MNLLKIPADKIKTSIQSTLKDKVKHKIESIKKEMISNESSKSE